MKRAKVIGAGICELMLQLLDSNQKIKSFDLLYQLWYALTINNENTATLTLKWWLIMICVNTISTIEQHSGGLVQCLKWVSIGDAAVLH